ncbi:MAG: glycosyltransferase family 2 protein [Verrucomicrobiota bacterium]|nr:glycosyltransferase family 2 protein [Verrucomicrobiota bacterium]
MKKFFFVLFVGLIAAWGFGLGFGWFDKPKAKELKTIGGISPEKDYPVTEYKSFAIVLCAEKETAWLARSLRSIFEQDYDHFRLIFINDGGGEQVSEIVQKFVEENHQEHRVILMKNDEPMGEVACLYRAAEQCLDREILLPLSSRDWLAQPNALSRLNRAFQNPDVWIAFGQSIGYPTYEFHAKGPHCFYSALFKQIPLHDLYQGGAFVQGVSNYVQPLLELSGGRVRHLEMPLAFANETLVKLAPPSLLPLTPQEPLAQFPSPKLERPRADLMVFSYDRPLQLYATLESADRLITGLEKTTVLYRASDDRFRTAYAEVQQAFPQVAFISQGSEPKKDFKPLLLKAVFGSPSEYILFAVDDLIVKDAVDLHSCMEMMEKTGAYGFYLRFGRHVQHCYQAGRPQQVPPSLPLSSGVYAWDTRSAELDWGFPNNLDMTLYRKVDLRKPLTSLRYRHPNSLEFDWAQDPPNKAIGLYFEHSKVLNLPLNVVTKTGNPHMNFLSVAELLEKFNEGLKIDIDPLFQAENASPHHEYTPEFIVR